MALSSKVFQAPSVEWYFVDNGQPQGPSTFEELQKFHRERRIQDQTLCWKEGLPEWKPFSSLVAEYAPRAAPDWSGNPSPFTPPGTPSSPTLSFSPRMEDPSAGLGPLPNLGRSGNASDMTVREHSCVQCRNVFSEEEMLRYQNYWVCAGCKPLFLEAISEGVVSRGRLTYATGVSRLGAYLIDYSFISVVIIPMSFLIQGVGLSSSFALGHYEPPNPLYQLLAMVFGFAALFLYYFVSVGLIQSTPGLLFFGIRLVRPDGSKISVLQGLAWTFCSVICLYTCNLMAISTYFDPEKRAIQEFIVNTRLVYKRN